MAMEPFSKMLQNGGGHRTIWGWGGGGGPEYGRTGSDSENRHTEVDSAGSYDPYKDFHEGYADYGDHWECSDVSLRLDLGFDYEEDLSMEVEEVLYGDPPNVSDTESADSKSDKPPPLKIPPKAPPRRCCWGVSKPSRAAQRGATALEEETFPTRAYSPGTRVGGVTSAHPRDRQSNWCTSCNGCAKVAAPQIGKRRSTTGGWDPSSANNWGAVRGSCQLLRTHQSFV
ncbi:hypothetical protein P4O66_002587 [Electrophorus voltai]|uniref:Uncharacterized protein n=1 Tax=Electrophorus voltai TaxID=2609070 RepID=A0AAD9DPX3_9TELE|nr:hypothetical protein P4O66_002587 [Electrophorus voltai]